MYYKIIEFKRILDGCKKQVQSNQNFINYLVVNLPRMKESMKSSGMGFLTVDFVLPKLSELGFYNGQAYNL
jgi:hypothetical protein